MLSAAPSSYQLSRGLGFVSNIYNDDYPINYLLLFQLLQKKEAGWQQVVEVEVDVEVQH